MDNKSVSGVVTGIIKFAGVALVKTGSDRINTCSAYIENLNKSDK